MKKKPINEILTDKLKSVQGLVKYNDLIDYTRQYLFEQKRGVKVDTITRTLRTMAENGLIHKHNEDGKIIPRKGKETILFYSYITDEDLSAPLSESEKEAVEKSREQFANGEARPIEELINELEGITPQSPELQEFREQEELLHQKLKQGTML